MNFTVKLPKLSPFFPPLLLSFCCSKKRWEKNKSYT